MVITRMYELQWCSPVCLVKVRSRAKPFVAEWLPALYLPLSVRNVGINRTHPTSLQTGSPFFTAVPLDRASNRRTVRAAFMSTTHTYKYFEVQVQAAETPLLTSFMVHT